MKRGIFLCAVAVLGMALSIPLIAKAEEAGKWYFTPSAGLLSPRDTDVESIAGINLDDTILSGTAETDNGLFLSAAVGRSFGRLRGEIEAFHGRFDFTEKAELSEAVTIGGVQFAPGEYELGDGNVKITGLMVNAWVDLGASDWSINPYLGGGVGLTRIKAPAGSDSGFSWQIGGGALFPVSENVSIDAKYRFMSTAYEPEFEGLFGDVEYEKLQSHAFTLGLKFTF